MIEKIVLTGFIFLAWIFILFFGVAFVVSNNFYVNAMGIIVVMLWIIISVKIILERLE